MKDLNICQPNTGASLRINTFSLQKYQGILDHLQAIDPITISLRLSHGTWQLVMLGGLSLVPQNEQKE